MDSIDKLGIVLIIVALIFSLVGIKALYIYKKTEPMIACLQAGNDVQLCVGNLK